MALAFGESYWDHLPDLVQNYIEDLAAIAIHLFTYMGNGVINIRLFWRCFWIIIQKFIDLRLYPLNPKYVLNV